MYQWENGTKISLVSYPPTQKKIKSIYHVLTKCTFQELLRVLQDEGCKVPRAWYLPHRAGEPGYFMAERMFCCWVPKSELPQKF